MGLSLTRELTNAYNNLSRRSLEEGGWPSLAARTTEHVADAVATRLPIDREAIRTELLDRMKGATEYLLSNVGVAVGGVTNRNTQQSAGDYLSLFPAPLRKRLDFAARGPHSTGFPHKRQAASNGARFGPG